jgi:HPt (histidine-containing phosphotransfer) domain-containing protein
MSTDPIDAPALAAQTFDDAELRGEILRMFLDQTPALVQAAFAATGEARRDVAHRIKGSALAVAARPLAEAAERLESAPASDAALTELESAVAAALDAARLLLSRDDD